MPLQSDKLRLLRRIPDIRFEEETRGYSKDQVDRVLANLAPLADEIERLQARLTESETRAASAEARLVEARSPSQSSAAPGMPPAPQPDFDETLRNTLVSAQRQADTTIREAKEESERLRTEAEFQSNALLADARDQSSEMTTEAVSYREKLMSEAVAERSKLLDEARDEAQDRVKAVEKELAEAHESERTKLVNQIDDLQETHKLLQEDVVRFEQHLKARSSEVRSALEEITAVLDDPERLRSKDGIEPADIEEFATADYPPIAVEVVALNDLEAEAQMAAEATARPGEVLNAADLQELEIDEEEIEAEAEDEEEYVYDEHDEAETYSEPAPEPEYIDDDPQIGVETQTVMPHMLQDGRSILNGDGDETEVPPPPPGANDQPDTFMDDLRRATSEDPQGGDAIGDFLDDKQDRNGGGWFGRRK
ncbi:MAG: DivIVA domain-containing protein [Acidimicrobiales bacterium]